MYRRLRSFQLRQHFFCHGSKRSFSSLRVAIVGVGGVGGPVAASLASAQVADAVTIVARGRTFEQLEKNGLQVDLTVGGELEKSLWVRCVSPNYRSRTRKRTLQPHVDLVCADCSADLCGLGPQSYVVICCKQGQQLMEVATVVQPLIGPDTVLVMLQNGIPFWCTSNVLALLVTGAMRFNISFDSPRYDPRNPVFESIPPRSDTEARLISELRRLPSVDPSNGDLHRLLEPHRIIGGAVYISGTRQRSHSSTVVVNNNQHDRNVLVIGEANEAIFPRFPGISRVATFQSLFEGGSPNISVEATSNPKETRDAVFQKLVANLSYNVLSALTGASGRVLCTSPDLRRLGVAMIDEAMAVAASLPGEDKIMFPRDALGIIDFIGQRHPPGSRKLPSMRQDLENGIPIERGAIIECLQEIGHVVGVSTPTINIMAALLRETERASVER